MEYNEETAKQLKEKHKLSPATLKTWAHRGTIPDKYADENYEPRKKLINEQDRQAQTNLLRALATEKFNVRSLSRLAGLKEFVLADAMQGKTALSVQELIAAKKAVNTIRNEAKAILTGLDKQPTPEACKKILASFIKRSELQFYVLMDRNKTPYDAFHSWATNRNLTFPNTQQVEVLKSALLVFLTETSI